MIPRLIISFISLAIITASGLYISLPGVGLNDLVIRRAEAAVECASFAYSNPPEGENSTDQSIQLFFNGPSDGGVFFITIDAPLDTGVQGFDLESVATQPGLLSTTVGELNQTTHTIRIYSPSGGSFFDAELCGQFEYTVTNQNTVGPPSGSQFNPFSIFNQINDPLQGRFESLGQIVSTLLPAILILGGMVALLFLIWGGFRYMTAQGDPKAISAARGTIVSAIIGLVLLASVLVILAIIEDVLKINILGNIVTPAFAQGVDIGCEFKLGGQCISNAFPNFGSLVTTLVNFALAAAGLVFFFMFVWGGLRYMLARGDDKLISDARQTITNSVIGLLIVISSFVIIGIIAAVTNADISIF